MADFSTILNPENTSLDLYCNAIHANQVYSQVSYAYAIQDESVTYDVNVDTPATLDLVSSNGITLSVSNEKLLFATPGIYNFTATASGTNTSLSSDSSALPGPFIGLKLVSYNALGSVLSSSILLAVLFPPEDSTPTEYPQTISGNCIFTIEAGDTVSVVYSASSTPTDFNVVFNKVNLSVNFISH